MHAFTRLSFDPYRASGGAPTAPLADPQSPVASEGDDTFVWTRTEQNPVVVGGGGFDTWDLRAYLASSFFYTQPATLRQNDQGGVDLVASMYVRGGGSFDQVIGQASSIERFLLGSGFSVDLSASQSDLTIVGSREGETIATGSGNDTLDSGGGDDALRPGGGNNVIAGGAGEDTVHLNYAYSASTIAREGGAAVIVSGTARNVLTGVERVVFSDRIVDLTADGRIVPDTVRIESSSYFTSDTLVGQATADSLFGHGGNDFLNGAGGNDWLFGGSGTDRLIGGSGDDYLDGGDAADAALYDGLRRQYEVTDTTVSSGSTGSGVDTLVSVEELRFADGVLVRDVADSNTLRAMRLYDAVFNRPADAAGLASVVLRLDQGQTLSFLAGSLYNSAEGQATFWSLSNQQFISLLYRTALNREADPAGLAFWTGQLSSMQRSEVIVAFAESAEHRAVMGEPSSGSLWVADAEALFVARLYDATLDRAPDAAGLVTWLGLLDGGMSLAQVVDAFVGSPEFAQRFGAVNNQAFVELLYRTCLDRVGDPAGVSYWASQLDGGASRTSVVLSFSESPEHIMLTGPAWAGGIRYADYVEASAGHEAGKASDALVSPVETDRHVDMAAHSDDAALPLPIALRHDPNETILIGHPHPDWM